MRWILITQKLDAYDDKLGFVIRWVEMLAKRLTRLEVICQDNRSPALPENVTVYSLGKESGSGRTAQAWQLLGCLHTLTPQVDGIFCHMIPRYVLFAAPWARFYRKPLLHWYTHREASRELRVARRLATHILTAAPGSYPLPSDKLVVMGHGIETDLYTPDPEENNPPDLILVGRLAQIKGQDRLLQAASRVMARGDSGPFRVVLVGGGVPTEPDYRMQLEASASILSPSPNVWFCGPLPHDQTAQLIRRSAIAVNLSPPGLFDKAALETMIAGKPTLVMNPDFLPLLGESADLLYVPYEASDDTLADHLAHLLRMSPQERFALGSQLRERTIMAHSLDRLMDRLVTFMHEVANHA